ncbi:MAG: peptidoglycan-binding protein [Clostridia bacterium]|nr:peptidoglycan-binding protein [Clostridia bacterium]
MKKTVLALMLAVLIVVSMANTAFAMTEEEVLEKVKENEGSYEIGGPLTKNDFIRYDSGTYSGNDREVFSDDSYMEEYEYDELLYLAAKNVAWTYLTSTKKEDLTYDSYAASYTYRGVNTDFDSKENVLSKYGAGVSGTFDPKTDVIYKYQNTHGSSRKKDAAELREKSRTYLLYNYKDFAQIKFYFNEDEQICFVGYYKGIQEHADKETTRIVQEYLNKNGYDCGKADGKTGKKTKAAISKFQEDHDMFPSGYIDDSMMKYLDGKL